MGKKRKKQKGFLQRFLTLDDTPHRIAAGAAVGLFMGILPIESVLATLTVTAIFRLNHAAALISVAATNIWAMIAALPLAAVLGGSMFGIGSSDLADQFYAVFQRGWSHFFTEAVFFNLTLPLIAGYALLSGIVSVICYIILYSVLVRQRRSVEAA